MKDPKPPEIPEGWTHARHREIEAAGIGEGFALFESPGQTLRGFLRTFFPTRHGRAVAIETTEPPTVSVWRSDDEGKREQLHPVTGTLVNMSLSGVDLERKLNRALRDVEVGVQYSHTIETKAGDMKVYRVVVFTDELPF